MRASQSRNTNQLLFVFLTVMSAAGGVRADFVFGTPTKVPNLNTSSYDGCPSISADGLEFYYVSNWPHGGDVAYFDIWVATRETTDDSWKPPVKLGPPVNTPAVDADPSLTADGLQLCFNDATPGSTGYPYRPGGHGGGDLWVSSRPTKDDDWPEPNNLGPIINSSAFDGDASLTANGLQLFFGSERPGGHGSMDLWVTARPTKDDDWSTPVNLGWSLNSSGWDGDPEISVDGLSLFFVSADRPGDYGGSDLYVTTRATTSDPWGPPVNLGQTVNTSLSDADPSLSGDGFTLYFDRGVYRAAGTWDLWQVSIIPIVDFTGDGKVDIKDLLRLIEYWGQEDPSVDVAPGPFGDGMVDVKDLEVLMNYWQQGVNDPTLLAHWALDETEGMFVSDSIGDNNAVVLGGVEWQPTDGQIDGALKLDGVSGYAITGAVLNPADGPFSVFAWVNGGVPGQVIVSQQNMANWLTTDNGGNLITELKCSGRSAGPLYSETVITDGQWHRIGLVWDDSHRMLFVDGVMVAEDTQHGLVGSQMGLYIGTGKGMEAGTYWSGLIDDVRIYDRSVHP